MKIKELRKEFERSGILYVQVMKTSEFVIYKCISKEFGYTYWELFKYRLVSPSPFEEGDWDKIELYPSTNDFGRFAWCCSNESCLSKMLLKHFGVEYEIGNLK